MLEGRAAMTDADPKPMRRVITGAAAIAAPFNKSARWLYRQLHRGKAPPPVFKLGGTVLAAYADELEEYVAFWHAKKRAVRIPR
jgi:hypothetical protein